MSVESSVVAGNETIRVSCKAKEVQDHYDADVPLDITGREIVEGLDEGGYLPALGTNDTWKVVHGRSGKEVNATLREVGAQDGDQIILDRASNGAGS